MGSFKVYVAPQAEIPVKQTGRSSQRIETAGRVVDVRTYALTFQNPGAPVDATVWTDESGRLLRFEVAAQSLLVVHEDLASVASRTQVMSRAGDQRVTFPGNGFNLTGTLSQPSGSPNAKGRYPAIILVAGSGFQDRDENIAGVPIFAQLAGGLADAGYYVLRYDKRGTGQSGGREEAATIDDYAEDLRAAVRFLRERKDVDPKRVVLFGHSEGAWVALVAASKEEENVAAVTLAGGASGTGGQLVLEQQSHLVENTTLSPAERQARIDLQKHIQAAVVGETSWDGVPEPLRRQADTPWFRSFLGFSPAPVIAKVKQPLLILQGTRRPGSPCASRREARRDGHGTKKDAAGKRACGDPRWGQSPAGASNNRRARGIPDAREQGRRSAGREDDGGLVGGGVGQSEVTPDGRATETPRKRPQRHREIGHGGTEDRERLAAFSRRRPRSGRSRILSSVACGLASTLWLVPDPWPLTQWLCG